MDKDMKINTEECDLCSGNGFINIGSKGVPMGGGITVTDYETKNRVRYKNILCPKCKGTGRTDWVSRVTGSRPTNSDLPLLEELTNKVHVLIKESNILGTDGIVLEHKRREILKKYGIENENKQ